MIQIALLDLLLLIGLGLLLWFVIAFCFWIVGEFLCDGSNFIGALIITIVGLLTNFFAQMMTGYFIGLIATDLGELTGIVSLGASLIVMQLVYTYTVQYFFECEFWPAFFTALIGLIISTLLIIGLLIMLLPILYALVNP